MFKLNKFKFIINAFFMLVACLVAAAAQTAPVTGKVEMQKADGTKTPVEGALVEVFRTDIKSRLPSDKTNKKGEFSFAGLPLGAIFVLSVSAPGATPSYLPNIKAGSEKLVITLTPGDGKKWSEEEIRTAAAKGASASDGKSGEKYTEESKKAEAERLRLIAEHEEKKKSVEGKNAAIQKALEDGNAAYSAKNYDAAIAKYNEGIEIDPDFAGSVPVLANNKAHTLVTRAVASYNTAIKLTDPAAQREAKEKVKKDFSDAIDAYHRAWTIAKSAPAADVNAANNEAHKLKSLSGAKEALRLMVKTEQVDDAKKEVAKTLITEYLTVETDQAKKTEAQVIMGDVYRVMGDSDNAIAAYRAVLQTSPDNLDALAGLGLSLFDAGVSTDNKTQRQEGMNFMTKFAEIAPETHPLKKSVKDAVDYLKTEGIAPQKVTSTKKKN